VKTDAQRKEVERVGALARKADSLVSGSQMPFPDHIHKQQLTMGMTEISRELKEIFQSMTGENPRK